MSTPERSVTPPRDETGLRDFINYTWSKYAEDSVIEEERSDGSFRGMVASADGHWQLVDTYHTNPEQTFFNGREVVFAHGSPIWAANYHATVTDPELSDQLVKFYLKLEHDPDFPAVGHQGSEDPRFRYEYESWPGMVLDIGRFAVRETIYYKPQKEKLEQEVPAFIGHLIGGWIT